MSESEENEKKPVNQRPDEDLSEDVPLFILPDDDLLTLPDGQRLIENAQIEEGAIDNAAPLEEIPETNFEFSTFNVKSENEAQPAETVPAETTAETMRKTGLAWSAAIVFFGSVVFMLILGWFADLLFGSSPWGIVVGILFGGVIGFFQFFRITSKILNPPKSDLENTPLKLNENHEASNNSRNENKNSTII